jgi:hypothetical protein
MSMLLCWLAMPTTMVGYVLHIWLFKIHKLVRAACARILNLYTLLLDCSFFA